LPDVSGRLRAVATALIAGVLLVGLAGPAATEAVDPPDLERFMAALGAVESHGRYEAVNATSGALGKYQILPANWRAWSRRYLGNPDAVPTPANQEEVARRKLTALYAWLDDWGVVAHWWLTGDGERDPERWSGFSRQYVGKVIAAMDGRVGRSTGSTPASRVQRPADARVLDDSNDAIDFSNGWGEAEFARYNGGQVRYADEAGATTWLTFRGRSIAWIGPLGPTRGEAKVYLDDELVATVDVYAKRFRPRAEIFSATFNQPETHTITIEVVGTPDRETIAVDEFVVGN
jgi:hypothetical protein